MKHIMIAGALILASTSAFAGNAVKDFGTTYQFRSATDKHLARLGAYLIRDVEKGYQERASNHTTHIGTLNNNTATSIGNWSNISCSGDAYCNSSQDNIKSTQGAQVNTGDTVNAQQSGDDSNAY